MVEVEKFSFDGRAMGAGLPLYRFTAFSFPICPFALINALPPDPSLPALRDVDGPEAMEASYSRNISSLIRCTRLFGTLDVVGGVGTPLATLSLPLTLSPSPATCPCPGVLDADPALTPPPAACRAACPRMPELGGVGRPC